MYTVFKLPMFRRVDKLKKEGKEEQAYDLLKTELAAFSEKILKHTKSNVTTVGKENMPPKNESVVFISNHQSYVDIPLLLCKLNEPHAFIAKKSLSKIFLINKWMIGLGCIFIDRDDLHSMIDVLNQAESWVEKGHSIVIFPEGTRTKTGDVGDFKGGAFRIALQAKVPIVPIAIDGTLKNFEGNHYAIKETDITLTVLPKIEVDSFSRKEKKELPDHLQNEISNILKKDKEKATIKS